MVWGGGGGHWPVRLDVCTFNIFFVILCNIFNPSKFFVYPTDTKVKTGNHQSHFNAHMSPSSQDERLPMKPVLTGQHVLSLNALQCWNERGCMAWVYLSFTERTTTHANIFSHNTTTHTNKFSQRRYTHHTFFVGIALTPFAVIVQSQPIMMTNKL